MKKMKNKNQKGFSLVELLVVVIIMALLSGVAYVGIQKARVKLNNNKVADDLLAIGNSLEAFSKDNQGLFPLPQPGSNQNVQCFSGLGAYVHDCMDPSVAFRQGVIDNNLLTKRYLQEVPVDPRSGNLYAYGVTADGKYFMVAGVTEEEKEFITRSSGNLDKSSPLPSLIRAYNGPQFVLDRGSALPYSPEALVLTATARNVTGTVTANGNPVNPGDQLTEKMVIETGPASHVDLYLSDGSVSSLEENSNLLLEGLSMDQNDREGIVTKVKLKLNLGKLWNKVVRLSKGSEFSVEATGAVAAVRGTEFGVDKAASAVTVRSGKVEIQDTQGNKKGDVDDGAGGEVKPGQWRRATVDQDGNVAGVMNVAAQDMEKLKAEGAYYKKVVVSEIFAPRVLSIAPDQMKKIFKISVENLYTTLGILPSATEVEVNAIRVEYEVQGMSKVYYTSVFDPIKDSPYNVEITLSDVERLKLRLEKVQKDPFGNDVEVNGKKVVESASQWSSPVTLRASENLGFEALNPGAKPRPALFLPEIPMQLIPDLKNDVSFPLSVTLLYVDPLELQKGLKYTVTDSKGFCKEDPPGNMIKQSPQSLTIKGEIVDPAIKQAECGLLVEITLPDGVNKIKAETKVILQRTEKADLLALGRLPFFSAFNAITRGNSMDLKWEVELYGAVPTKWEIHGQGLNNNPLYSLNDTRTHQIPDLKAKGFKEGQNAIRVKLFYKDPKGVEQSVESALQTFFLAEASVLRIQYANPPDPKAVKVKVGDKLVVKALAKETSDKNNIDQEVSCVFDPSNYATFNGNEITFTKDSGGVAIPIICKPPLKQMLNGNPYRILDPLFQGPIEGVNLLTIMAEVQAAQKTLADVCTKQSLMNLGLKGDMINGECWVVADWDINITSCQDACFDLGRKTNLPNPVGCVADVDANQGLGSWNDAVFDSNTQTYSNQCLICKGLTGAMTCQIDTNSFAPLFISGFNECKYRNINITQNQTCKTPPTAGKTRICKCQ